MFRRPLLILIVVVLATAAIAVFGWLRHKEQAQINAYEKIYADAAELLETGQPDEALELLETYFNATLADTDLKDWPPLMVQAAVDSKNYGHLEHLVNNYPETLSTNESAALWWLRAQMHRRLWSKTASILEAWPENNRALPNRWKLLEADRFLLKNDLESAEASLRSWSGAGHEEVNRQLRLALLAGNDVELIYKSLIEAYEAMPNSPELRATAAQFFERNGDFVYARREYIAAFLLSPENPFHADQLAQYYVRTLALPQAIETWRQCFDQTEDARSWWSVWFWERVTVPRGEPLRAVAGNWWGTLLLSLEQTESTAFLPDPIFTSDIPSIVAKDPYYHWLVVLEHLRRSDNASALESLENMERLSIASVNQDLRVLLTALLDWQIHGDWPREVALRRGVFNHRFLRELENFRPKADANNPEEQTSFEAFLASEHAPGVLLLAHGWLGAADRLLPNGLNADQVQAINELDWLPYAYCKLKARLHGPEKALTAANAFKNDWAVRGFAAEMLLGSGSIDEGLSELEIVAENPGGAGYRASYLLAIAYLDRLDHDSFDALVARRKDLAESVVGKELHARQARSKGNTEEALRIYESLGDESMEGCVYRYYVARESGNTDTAREMLKTLMRLAPNEPVFHQWMSALESTGQNE